MNHSIDTPVLNPVISKDDEPKSPIEQEVKYFFIYMHSY